ncbi:MAG TPA: serine hydrolase [Thermoanaerobaculia bacterium]|nr:serine hydrolase [Thermoanaerobaculia bacterium]
MRSRRPATVCGLVAALIVGACVHLRAPATGPDEWEQVASPSAVGFSAAGLEDAFRRAEAAGSAAVMVVYRGHVLAAWGDVERELELHSVRKSLYGALYGVAVDRGVIDLEATLAELEIQDLSPLTPLERSARVADLLAARSGVYHPSAYSPSDMDEGLPPRGSQPPSATFYYNNWDFNVAAAVLERQTGEDLDELFARWIAEPIGMQDWRPGDSYEVFEPRTSRWPAHTFRMSTRDLARFGQLILQQGAWRGEQVLPREWVVRSTRIVTGFEDGSGYGLLWWVYPPGVLSADRYPTTRRFEVIQARGSGGQALFVVPQAELALVHRGDTDRGEGVSGAAVWGILEAVLDARTRPAGGPAELVPLAPRPLPPVSGSDPLRLESVDVVEVAELIGRYELAPGVFAEVFPFEGRAYIEVPGEGEAELFALADGLYALRVEPGVRIAIERNDEGRVAALVVTLGERRMRATRVP